MNTLAELLASGAAEWLSKCIDVEFVRVDKAERIVYGTVLVADKRDLQGDILDDTVLRQAAHGFMEYQHLGERHVETADAYLIESHIENKRWLIGVKIRSEALWNKVVDGVYKGFSIGARALRMLESGGARLVALIVKEISFVGRPAVPDALISLTKADDDLLAKYEERLLIEKIEAGDVAPRVNFIAKGLRELLEAGHKLLQSCTSGKCPLEESLSDESLTKDTNDMDPDKLKELLKAFFDEAIKPVADAVTSLRGDVDSLKKSVDESATKSAAESKPAEQPEALTKNDLADLLKPVIEAQQQQSETLKKLSERVDNIDKIAEQSKQAQYNDNNNGARPQPKCTLSVRDPRRGIDAGGE